MTGVVSSTSNSNTCFEQAEQLTYSRGQFWTAIPDLSSVPNDTKSNLTQPADSGRRFNTAISRAFHEINSHSRMARNT